MNGIVGSWAFRGSCNALTRAQQLAAALSYGRPDIHSKAATFALGETQGFIAERGGQASFLSADITLYDRGSLCEALGISGQEDRRSDRELVWLAFERWGEDCFGRLNGDFAIALFDERANRLYLARDHSGLRPLHFRLNQAGIDFCSMARPLAKLDGQAASPDWDRWLQYHVASPQLGSQSFFQNVERVEPAEVVAIDPHRVRRWRHWAPPAEAIDLPYAQVVEAVSERLKAAVRDRMRGPGRIVAAHLSSGMDSSAVVAFAACDGSPLLALTGVPQPGEYPHLQPGYIADESEVAAATAALYPSVEHRRVRAKLEPLMHVTDLLHRNCEQPQRTPANYGWGDATFVEAAGAGARILLSGNNGNLFFSQFGEHAFSELLIERRFREWAQLAAQHWRRTPVRLRGIIAHSLPAILPAPLYRAALRAGGRLPPDNFRDHYLNLKNPRVEAFRRLAGEQGWLSESPQPDGRKFFAEALSWNDYGPVNFGVRRFFGVEERDPTCDRRLLELTLALPSKYFMHGGIPRSLARDVLKGRVAQATLDGIRGRQGQDWPLAYQLSRGQFAVEISAIGQHPVLSSLIDVERLQRDEALFETDERRHDNDYRYELVMRTIAMARFARTIDDA